jgi:hypothetical protein
MNYIVTQFKNEKSRIKEWIEFHFKNGFDKILIYLDHPTDGSDELIKDLVKSNSNLIYFYVKNSLNINYTTANDYGGNEKFIRCLRENYLNGLNYIKTNFVISEDDWVAFIDVDEFLVKTGADDLNTFLQKINNKINRIYLTSYDMKCPLDLSKSVVQQSLYRWSDKTRNNSIFISRGKSMSRIMDLYKIDCVHCLDSNKQFNPNHKNIVMSSGGLLDKRTNDVIIDVYHDQEYFKLFHYRNHALHQVYDQYDDSALKML